MKLKSLIVLLLIVSGVPGGPLLAAEQGSLPYKRISELFDRFAELAHKDKLLLKVAVVPAKETLPPPTIALTIETGTNQIRLKLGEDGSLLDFPLSAELKKQNPRVVSNQPKGTLSLRASVEIRYSGKLTEETRWYLDAIQEANAAAKAQAGLLSFAAPKAKTLAFHFAAWSSESLSFVNPDGTRRVYPESAGAVRISERTLQEFKDAKAIFTSPPKSITLD